jgi:hypothetical protein
MAMRAKRSAGVQEAERRQSPSERRRASLRSIGVLLFEWRARMAAIPGTTSGPVSSYPGGLAGWRRPGVPT